MAKKSLYWFKDYAYATKKHIHSIVRRKIPSHYISDTDYKGDIILIPGVYEKWQFLKKIGDFLSREGYSVHIVEEIKRNRQAIHKESSKLHAYIEKNKIKDAVIIAHSKGGLVGKHYLVNHNKDNRVIKLIAIATPFSGSNIAKIIKTKAVKELHPEGQSIQALKKITEVNQIITSIFPESDNQIWHKDRSFVENGKNIVLKIKGHHKILDSKELIDVIKQELENLN
jgi:triacylglycerol lipase